MDDKPTIVTQFIGIRKAQLPTTFRQFQLLTEYVVAPDYAIQVFCYRNGKHVQFWVIQDMNNVIISIVQLAVLNSTNAVITTEWDYSRKQLKTMKNLINTVLTGEFGVGSDLFSQWVELGDRLLAGYTLLATVDFENEQLDKALSGVDYPNDDDSIMATDFDGSAWLDEVDLADEWEEAINSAINRDEDD